MMRYGAMIICVVLLGAGAVVVPAAPQDEPASDPPKANTAQSAASPTNAAPSQDAPAADDPFPHRPEFRRWSEHGFGRGAREFTKEQIERVMQVVRDLDPDRAARLEEMRKSDPERFAVGLARAGRHLLGLSLLKDRDPELYELKLEELRLSQQVNRIAQEILAARETCSEDELERLESMLRDRLRKQNEYNYRARAREIVLLDKHLTSMRENLEEDIKYNEERIESRMAELLRESEADADADTFAVEDAPH